MNIEDLTLKQIREIQSLSSGNSTGLSGFAVGKHCIFRTYSAGVFFGILKSREGKEAVIQECRRIWSWTGAFTLSKIALDGVESAKLSVSEPEKLVTEVIEVIPASEKCTAQLKGMKAHAE